MRTLFCVCVVWQQLIKYESVKCMRIDDGKKECIWSTIRNPKLVKRIYTSIHIAHSGNMQFNLVYECGFFFGTRWNVFVAVAAGDAFHNEYARTRNTCCRFSMLFFEKIDQECVWEGEKIHQNVQRMERILVTWCDYILRNVCAKCALIACTRQPFQKRMN